ncbi:hypothetical protein CPB86DRAFT_595406, partial [Serendipita vermifera]
IFSWSLLLSKIRQDELPALKAIYVQTPHLSGCVDSPWTLRREAQDIWRTAIKICRQKGIQLLSLENHTIHLWEERHGIRTIRRRKVEQSGQASSNLEGSGEESDGDEYLTNTSDDSQWYRLETESDLLSENSAREIDDDSDDEPYRYVDQPDIEMAESDSDSNSDKVGNSL